jgi:hypothetical protein
VWAGVDNAWEQGKLEAWKMLENAAESHTACREPVEESGAPLHDGVIIFHSRNRSAIGSILRNGRQRSGTIIFPGRNRAVSQDAVSGGVRRVIRRLFIRVGSSSSCLLRIGPFRMASEQARTWSLAEVA